MGIVSTITDWLRPAKSLRRELTATRAYTDALVKSSYGERMMGRMSLPMMGYGLTSGAWSDNRYEQVRHFRQWVYVAVHAIAKQIAQQQPNVSLVRQLAPGRQQKWLNETSRRKAQTHLHPHEDLEPLDDAHPLCELFRNPNDPDTPYDLWYETALFLLLTGNAYWWLPPNGFGLPAEIWVLPSHWIWPVAGSEAIIDSYDVRPYVAGTTRFNFPAEDIVHLKFKSPLSKIDGYSPLTAGAQWVDTAESIDQARWSSFKNGAFPGVQISLSPEFTDPSPEDISRVEARFLNKFVGERNTARPIITPAGMELKPLLFPTPREMDYSTSMEQIRDMVLTLYGVSKAIVGITTEVNYASMVAAQAGFCRFTINPLLSFIGQVLTEKLAARYDRDLRIWWMDCSPNDPAQELAEQQADVAAGARTPNEIRQQRGLEPYKNGGDDPLVPMGLSPMPLNSGDDLQLSMSPAEAANYAPAPANGEKPPQAEESRPSNGAPNRLAGKAWWHKSGTFNESDHPRADDGKFGLGSGSGSSNGGGTATKPKPAKKPVDPAANRPSKSDERHDVQPPAKKFKSPPPPKGTGSGKAGGLAATGQTNTAVGDHAEAVLEQLGLRSILPEGKRQNPLDREYDHSGVAFEIKACTVNAKEYKAKPKAHEMEEKRAYAKKHKLKPATMIAVVDHDKGEIHAYWRDGIGAYQLNPKTAEVNGWKYMGTVKYGKKGA